MASLFLILAHLPHWHWVKKKKRENMILCRSPLSQGSGRRMTGCLKKVPLYYLYPWASMQSPFCYLISSLFSFNQNVQLKKTKIVLIWMMKGSFILDSISVKFLFRGAPPSPACPFPSSGPILHSSWDVCIMHRAAPACLGLVIKSSG